MHKLNRLFKSNKAENAVRGYVKNSEDPKFMEILEEYVSYSVHFKKDKKVTRETPLLLASEVSESHLSDYFIKLNNRDRRLFVYVHFARRDVNRVVHSLRMLMPPFNEFEDSHIFETNLKKSRKKDLELGERNIHSGDESLLGALKFRYDRMEKHNVYKYYGEERVYSVMNALYKRKLYGNEAILDILEKWALPENKDYPIDWVLDIS